MSESISTGLKVANGPEFLCELNRHSVIIYVLTNFIQVKWFADALISINTHENSFSWNNLAQIKSPR